MIAEYFERFSDGMIKPQLLQKENISAIEHIIDRESQELEKLQKLKNEGKLDFGSKLSSEKMRDLFLEVSIDVNKILQVDDVDLPKYGYNNIVFPLSRSRLIRSLYGISFVGFANLLASSVFCSTHQTDNILFYSLMSIMPSSLGIIANKLLQPSGSYHFFKNKVFLEKRPQKTLSLLIAHEYAHKIQHAKGFNVDNSQIFAEGHARGVTRMLARNYHKSQDDESFLYLPIDYDVAELKVAYKWMCYALNYKVKPSLIKTVSNRDRDEQINLRLDGEPSPHAIGNALLSICELVQGTDIYRQIIHQEFDFYGK